MGIHRMYRGTINMTTSDISGDQVITGVGGKPSFMVLSAINDSDASNDSDGFDDGVSWRWCSYRKSLSLLTNLLGGASLASFNQKDAAISIKVENTSNNGWSGLITALGQDGFTITWTKLGSGLNITLKYIALT